MRFLRWMNKNFEEALLIGFLIAMVAIMTLQIICRYVINYSLSWTEEITRYLFIWSGFLSISYCVTKGIAIKIDLLTEALKPKTRHYIKIISNFLELIFFMYMLPFAFQYFSHALLGGYKSPACRLPLVIIYAAPLISFALAIIRLFQGILAEISVLRGIK